MTNTDRAGLGVLLHMLGGEASAHLFAAAIGRTLASVAMDSDELLFTFADGSRLALSDEGQSCCESRYMTTDDDLATFAGATLLGAEVADGPEIAENASGESFHETQFLRVKTSKGTIVCVTHNEHSGYYSGFAVRCLDRT